MTQRARLVKAGAGVAASIAPRAFVRDRLCVNVSSDHSSDELRDVLPEHFLAATLRRDNVPVAITFGSARPNRKPVLQAIGSGGMPIAYMKVAWNALTADLVRNERRALDEWTEAPPSLFRVPELLQHDRWNEHEVAVTRAFPHALWRTGPLDDRPGPSVLRHIAERDGATRQPLGSAALWKDIRDHVGGTTHTAVDDDALALTARFEADFGGLEALTGTWHGDWAPWNMATTRDGLTIWDWERSRAGVPVGLDLAHFEYQLGVHRIGLGPTEAARRACELTDLPLRDLGIAAGTWRPLVCLYLFELFRRYADGATEGVAGATMEMSRAILTAIRRTAWVA
jgi:hypothetical protein